MSLNTPASWAYWKIVMNTTGGSYFVAFVFLGESRIILWDFTSTQKQQLVKREKKINFSQSIQVQKKALKIYGKTRANTKIVLNVSWKEFETRSNDTWNYSLKISDLSEWEYLVLSQLYDADNTLVSVWKEKNFSLSQGDIASFQKYRKTYTQEQRSLVPKVVAKENKQKAKEMKVDLIDYPNNDQQKWGESGELRVIFLIFMSFISMLYGYLVIYKKKII